MKLAMMTYSYGPAIRSGQTTLVDAMRFTRELGVKGIDFMAGLYDGPADEMKKIMEDLDVEPAIYTQTGQDFCRAGWLKRRGTVKRVCKGLDRAREMGFDKMMVTTGAIPDGMSREDCARRVGEGLRRCVRRATELGMKLTFEDFPGPKSPHATSDECLAVCEAAGPDLRMTFDSGNAYTWNEDPVDTWNAVKHKVVHAHLKDWGCPEFDAEPRGIKGKEYSRELVGEGLIDYPRLLATIKESGYDGYMAFEYEGKDDRLEAAKRGVAYLQKTIAELP